MAIENLMPFDRSVTQTCGAPLAGTELAVVAGPPRRLSPDFTKLEEQPDRSTPVRLWAIKAGDFWLYEDGTTAADGLPHVLWVGADQASQFETIGDALAMVAYLRRKLPANEGLSVYSDRRLTDAMRLPASAGRSRLIP